MRTSPASAIRVVCVAAMLSGFAASAAAAPITFFAQDLNVFDQSGAPTGAGFPNSAAAEAAFLANLTGVGTESFESFPDGTGAPIALVFPGAGTATLTGGGAVDDDPSTGQNAVDGTKWWRTGIGNNFAIDFSAPIAAFGFYGIDVGDIGAQLTLTLSNGTSVSIDLPHGIGANQNGNVLFFGYIDPDNPWTRAEFANVGGGGGDDFGFDRMTIGSAQQVTPVPEPATMALLLGGAAMLGVRRSRRNRQNA